MRIPKQKTIAPVFRRQVGRQGIRQKLRNGFGATLLRVGSPTPPLTLYLPQAQCPDQENGDKDSTSLPWLGSNYVTLVKGLTEV